MRGAIARTSMCHGLLVGRAMPAGPRAIGATALRVALREEAMTGEVPASPRGLFALLEENPEAADKAFLARECYPDRRGFLRGMDLATMGAMLGAAIPFHRRMPTDLIPVALADAALLQGKGRAVGQSLKLSICAIYAVPHGNDRCLAGKDLVALGRGA